MRAFRKLGIAAIVCALSGAAWAQPGNGNGGGNGNRNGNGNSGTDNGVLQSVISLPQIVTAPLTNRSSTAPLVPVATHTLPSNSITDNPNRGVGLKGPDFKENGRDFAGRDGFDRPERLYKLDRKQTTLTKSDEKTGKGEKAEKDAETRLAANTTGDAPGSRKGQYQPEQGCR